MDEFYSDLLEDLKVKLLDKFGSLTTAAVEIGINRSNLSSVLSGAHEISVGLYLTICSSLNVVGPLPTGVKDVAIPLREYMAVDHDMVTRSLLSVMLK